MLNVYAAIDEWGADLPEELVPKVREELVHQLFRQTWGGLFGTLIIIGAASYILWPALSAGQLLLWGGLFVLITLARAGLIIAFFRAKPSGTTIAPWARLHVLGAALAAAMWSGPSILLWPISSPIHELIWPICIVAVAVAAAAVAMYCCWPPSGLAFLLVAMAPVCIRLLISGNSVYLVLGCLGLLFIVILSWAGYLMYRSIVQGIVISLRNQALSQVLSGEKQKVEQLNVQLVSEVEVRRRSQRELQERNLQLEELNATLTRTKLSLEATNRELKDALANVRQLSGMLPICASCKKIRNDKGYWQQLEAYFHDRSEVEFSHGICPDCYKKLDPGGSPFFSGRAENSRFGKEVRDEQGRPSDHRVYPQLAKR